MSIGVWEKSIIVHPESTAGHLKVMMLDLHRKQTVRFYPLGRRPTSALDGCCMKCHGPVPEATEIHASWMFMSLIGSHELLEELEHTASETEQQEHTHTCIQYIIDYHMSDGKNCRGVAGHQDLVSASSFSRWSRYHFWGVCYGIFRTTCHAC